MKTAFLQYANLPQGDVKRVIISECDKTLTHKLSEISVDCFLTAQNSGLNCDIASHPDILCYHFGNGSFLIDSSQNELCRLLLESGADVITTDGIYGLYPNDCALNCADIGDFIICNEKIANPAILSFAKTNGKTVVNVRQGYSKCSVCICGHNIIITDDLSVYRAVSQYPKIKALFVEKGSVTLKGRDYGFIGGCTGLIGRSKLFFNGDLSFHSDCKKIIGFLKYNDISYIEIKNKPLTDVGSIIPIIEVI